MANIIDVSTPSCQQVDTHEREEIKDNQGEPVKPKMRANNTHKQRERKQVDLNATSLRAAEMLATGMGKRPSTEIILDSRRHYTRGHFVAAKDAAADASKLCLCYFLIGL